MVEEAIVYQLKTVSSLGDRVYPVIGESGCKAPFCTYLQTREEAKRALSGPVGLTEADYAINILAATYAETKSLRALVQTALDLMPGSTISGTLIKKLVVRPETTEFWDVNLNLYGKQLNFTITY